jgi:Tfp pilus assembly protein PilE
MLEKEQKKNLNKEEKYGKKIELKNFGSNVSGITLVSLVVTIIVLLILAGISLNSVVGNGIIGKTQEASKKSEIADIKEKIATYQVQLEMEDEESSYWLDTDDITDYIDSDSELTSMLEMQSGVIYYKNNTPEEYKTYFEDMGIESLPDNSNLNNASIQIEITGSDSYNTKKENGILTITLDGEYKINPNPSASNKFKITIPEELSGTYIPKTYEYELSNLPSEIKYDERTGTLQWNIRKYSDCSAEALDLLAISFDVVSR